MNTRLIVILIIQLAAIACWFGCDFLQEHRLQEATYHGHLTGMASEHQQISDYLASKGLLPEGRLSTAEMNIDYPPDPSRDSNDVQLIFTWVYLAAWVLTGIAIIGLLMEIWRSRIKDKLGTDVT